jgi:prepilin signal peptidase PulO-like enzyme (type II secretory pathway)
LFLRVKPDSMMLMVNIELAIFLGVLGAAMGSFAGALAWRLHTGRNFVSERSECEHCHHKLSLMDLIPVISWLMLGGKCRYCGRPIGWLPFITEITLTALYAISFVYWPLGFASWQAVTLFVLWLSYLVALSVLVIYDARWMLLPDKIVLPLVVVAFGDAALRVSLMPGASVMMFVQYVGYGLVALAGVYGLLYAVSKGKWVGLGDVKLSIFIGAILGWQKALLVLCLSNVIGFLVVVPGLLTKKLDRTSRIPFGPYLIVAFVIAGLFGDAVIHWYQTLIGI